MNWSRHPSVRLVSQDCPLVLVLRMFEMCCDYRNFSEAKAKLLDFQRTLIAVRKHTHICFSFCRFSQNVFDMN